MNDESIYMPCPRAGRSTNLVFARARACQKSSRPLRLPRHAADVMCGGAADDDASVASVVASEGRAGGLACIWPRETDGRADAAEEA